MIPLRIADCGLRIPSNGSGAPVRGIRNGIISRMLVPILLAPVFLAGCLTTDRLPGPVDDIAGLELQVKPEPVDWQGDAAPDGLAAQVRLYSGDPVRAVTVTGTLELLLYEGVVKARHIAQNTPLRTWSFSGQTLRRQARADLVGCHHVLQLPWGPRRPPPGPVTLVARYRPPDGPWTYSEPNASIVIPQK